MLHSTPHPHHEHTGAIPIPILSPDLTTAVAPVEPDNRILPYASEPFGVYQPLIGWRSSLQLERLTHAIAKRVIGASRVTGPLAHVSDSVPIGSIGVPLRLEDHTNTQIGRAVALQQSQGKGDDLVNFLKDRSAKGAFSDLTRKVLKNFGGGLVMDPLPEVPKLPVPKVRNETAAEDEERVQAEGGEAEEEEEEEEGSKSFSPLQVTPPAPEPDNSADIRALRQEAMVATVLSHLAETNPDAIRDLFRPKLTSFERSLHATKLYVDITAGQGRQAFLSPIGILHLFKEYFFHIGTFLGPPVGHVWVSPGGTVELYEISTRRTVTERSVEQSIQTKTSQELDQTDKDEISDAVKTENASNTKFGASATVSGGFGPIFQASGSASFNLDNSRKEAQETTHTKMREQSSKLTSEVSQNFKTTFRTMTETTDSSSRRYVLQNTTEKLISYELSRKMRKVAVQVQDLGRRLCWQLYIDDPGASGATLGTAEFVHASAAACDPSLKVPERKPYPPNIEKTFTSQFPFVQYKGGDDDNDDTYIPKPGNHNRGVYDTGLLGVDNNEIEFRHTVQLPIPPQGYRFQKITAIDFHGASVRWHENVGPVVNGSKFELLLTHANFGGKMHLPFDVTVVYEPTADIIQQIDSENAKSQAVYDDQVAVAKDKLFFDTIRKRLALVGKVAPRSANDLREEERSTIYSRLISKLYGSQDGWTNEDYHLTSELIRYYFDIDSMLYFVAPDWWRPKKHRLVTRNQNGLVGPTAIGQASMADRVERQTQGLHPTPTNGRTRYLVTEETSPAPYGSSLGWMHQLDGDKHRNAFLNSPWVKAVLPIRPGREKEAIAFLQRPEVAGTDGLDAVYSYNPAQDPPSYQGKTLKQVLLIIADQIRDENEKAKKPVPVKGGGDPVNQKMALPTEMVYANGYEPLEGGVKFGKEPFVPFSEWTEVLPTDQVVATEYSLKGV